MEEVVRLQQHVAEFGVADAVLAVLQALSTESFAIIMLTEKCLPTSRRTSMNESLASQRSVVHPWLAAFETYRNRDAANRPAGLSIVFVVLDP